MATGNYRAPGNGAGTFSDNLVGFQLVDGGGLTQGNFEFTTAIVEKSNREFSVGAFSKPISLEDLQLRSLEEAKKVFVKEFSVVPNFDLSEVTNYSLYGSLQKRFSATIQHIINFFPAALEVDGLYYDYSSANTATNISYDSVENETEFVIDVTRIKNPFDIDFSVNATRNIEAREQVVSEYRNLGATYINYSLYVDGVEYPVNDFIPSANLTTGTITFIVEGNPFSGQTSTFDKLIIRLNDNKTEMVFSDNFDELGKFLLNRLITPKYTAFFKVPRQTTDGQKYTGNEKLTWPLDGSWNLDVRTISYTQYLEKLNSLAEEMDTFKTNLISRFLTTGAFKDFDTEDQKVEKVLQIYGRSFDELKKFIDGLAYINSVHYNLPNSDIPSQLLSNLATTLGWNENISQITNQNFLESVFSVGGTPIYSGYSRDYTPTELNFQFYRNLILNSAYLFKSKGTKRSVEFLMRMIGAPESMVEFNETIFLADGPINIDQFETYWSGISGGSKVTETVVYDTSNVYQFQGVQYCAFTLDTQFEFVNLYRSDYPFDDEGYPKPPTNNNSFFYQKGAGWYERTPYHVSPLEVDTQASVYTGNNPVNVTKYQNFSYGFQYLNTFTNFPDIKMGFSIRQIPDNQKSWTNTQLGLRRSTIPGYEAYYQVDDDRLVLNSKNIDLNMNIAKPLEYDVWLMSIQSNYPIPSTGLTITYPGDPYPFVINPKPTQKTFFEFAQTFYNKMVNVPNRWYDTDGKTSGYPLLQSLYWKYLNSQATVGIPSNQFTYQKMIDFTIEIGDRWMKLVEQMIPSSTIWNGGVRFENSQFHRQKFVYRRQRGCQIVPVPCKNCWLECYIFTQDCIDETVTCSVYPWSVGSSISSFNSILTNRLDVCLLSNSYTYPQVNLDTLVSEWYVDLKIGTQQIVLEKFYEGYGSSDAPTSTDWLNALNTYLTDLHNYGFNYYINNNQLTVSNTNCYELFSEDTFYLRVGINFTFSLN